LDTLLLREVKSQWRGAEELYSGRKEPRSFETIRNLASPKGVRKDGRPDPHEKPGISFPYIGALAGQRSDRGYAARAERRGEEARLLRA